MHSNEQKKSETAKISKQLPNFFRLIRSYDVSIVGNAVCLGVRVHEDSAVEKAKAHDEEQAPEPAHPSVGVSLQAQQIDCGPATRGLSV